MNNDTKTDAGVALKAIKSPTRVSDAVKGMIWFSAPVSFKHRETASILVSGDGLGYKVKKSDSVS